MKKLFILCLAVSFLFSGTVSAGSITVDPTYSAFRGMKYGTFRRDYNTEAVWLNSFASSANVPGTRVYAVFERSNQSGSLTDSDSLYRLSGNVRTFFPGVEETMTPSELAGYLKNATVEIKEAPPTIYYISDNYAEIQFDDDGDGKADTQATIALYKDGKFSPDTDAWLFFLDE